MKEKEGEIVFVTLFMFVYLWDHVFICYIIYVYIYGIMCLYAYVYKFVWLGRWVCASISVCVSTPTRVLSPRNQIFCLLE